MNKQLTPMQELYQELDKLQIDLISVDDIKRMIGNYYVPKEKQVIIEARENGFYSSENWKGDSQDYYNNKFKND